MKKRGPTPEEKETQSRRTGSICSVGRRSRAEVLETVGEERMKGEARQGRNWMGGP